MNALNIKMRASYDIKYPQVTVDGETVKLKKDKDGFYSCRYETEKDGVELSICKFLEINGKLWFLFSLLFFFISALGIFDAHYDKKCICLHYKIALALNGENTVKLTYNRFKEKGSAIKCTADCSFEELENEYYTDLKAKKRLKTMRIVKALIWLAAIAAAVTITVIKIWG